MAKQEESNAARCGDAHADSATQTALVSLSLADEIRRLRSRGAATDVVA
jgi:hypothetical protein